MKLLATVMMWKLLKMNKKQQIKYIKDNLSSKEFQELIYLGYHTSIDFRVKLPEDIPRPQAPLDKHKEFFKLAMASVRDQFNEGKRNELLKFVKETDPLSKYIYSKIINKTLGLSRNDLEDNIPGLIVKEPYELIAPYGSPKLPCIMQTYDIGVEAIVTIGDLGVTRDINLLKDKGGVAVSGFDKHIDAIKALGLKGTFNVVINGKNEAIFLEHILGNNEKEAIDSPIIIIDYQINVKLSSRLATVEIALVEHPQTLVVLAKSFWVRDLKNIQSTLEKVVARQDIEPVIRELGTHSIDVSQINKGVK